MELAKFALKVIAVIAVVRVIENAVVPQNSSLRQWLP